MGKIRQLRNWNSFTVAKLVGGKKLKMVENKKEKKELNGEHEVFVDFQVPSDYNYFCVKIGNVIKILKFYNRKGTLFIFFFTKIYTFVPS